MCYFGFYFTVYFYPSSLSDYVKNGNWIWLGSYVVLHVSAIYFFLTSGSNPGWVLPDPDYDSVDIQDSIDLECGGGGSSSNSETKYHGGEEEKSWNSDGAV